MTIIDPSDLTRYTSGYALVVITQAEQKLRRDLADLPESDTLNPADRDRVVYGLRAARTAALRASGAQDGH